MCYNEFTTKRKGGDSDGLNKKTQYLMHKKAINRETNHRTDP